MCQRIGKSVHCRVSCRKWRIREWFWTQPLFPCSLFLIRSTQTRRVEVQPPCLWLSSESAHLKEKEIKQGLYITKIYFHFAKVCCCRLRSVTFLTARLCCWGFLTLMHVPSGATGSLDRCSL